MATVRRAGFWARDWGTGSPVGRALRELEDSVAGHWDAGVQSRIRQARLSRLLDHAASTVPAYADMSGAGFTDYPVVTKETLRHGGPRHLSRVYSTSDVTRTHTGGSTGVPFEVRQNTSKKVHVQAELLHFTGALGYRVGDPFIFVRQLMPETRKSRPTQWMQGLTLVDCRDLSVPRLRAMMTSLRITSRGEAVLLAYASTLDAIKDLLEAGDFHGELPRFKAVISGAETLADGTRETVSEAFGCPCVSRYSNQENGVLAQDAATPNLFLANHAHYIFEVLTWDEDAPAAPGEQGRIVVTDLHNWAMPMIRYDTGDIGALETVEVGGVRRLAVTELSGRRVDWLTDANDRRVSPHVITTPMGSFADLHQYQFVQVGRAEYVLRLRTSRPYGREAELHAVLIRALGAAATVRFEYVAEIPRTPSGKHRHIINQTVQ